MNIPVLLEEGNAFLGGGGVLGMKTVDDSSSEFFSNMSDSEETETLFNSCAGETSSSSLSNGTIPGFWVLVNCDHCCPQCHVVTWHYCQTHLKIGIHKIYT